MVSPGDLIHVYEQLTSHNIEVWLTGGWGIDALLGEQTRPHKDLDMLMLVDDVTHMRELLAQEGYKQKELWSENLWTTDKDGDRIATAFVLRDQAGHELDAHAMRLDEQGNAVPAWENEAGSVLTAQDLSGQGMVAGVAVRCHSAESQMQCHTGYPLPDYQWDDLNRLAEKFGIEIPAEIVMQRSEVSSKKIVYE
jgi:lincosamide nucleotidyltransferase A/C/D/E